MVLIHGVLLHGRLSIRVSEAADLWLPTERSVREKLARAVICHSALNPYVTVSLEHLPKPSKRLLKTHAIPATDHPTWQHHQEVDVATNVSYVIVHVKSAGAQDVAANPPWLMRKSLGFVRIKAEHVLWNVVDGWFPLTGLHGIHHDRAAPKNRGRIRMTITYSPVDAMMLFGQPSVPGTYYSATEGCHVQLFQDAHCPEGAVMSIRGSSDAMYAEADVGQPGIGVGVKRRRFTNYFEQIYYSVLNARKMVYISGWSVDTTLHLLRKRPEESSESDSTRSGGVAQMSLGELLKFKASQGLTVLLLVWDEVLSTSNALLRIKGIMDTRDEVTRAFFRHSNVKAAVVPRLGGMSGKVIKAPLVSCLFTFHEKVVVTDIPAFKPRCCGDRELVAFCGGLDLTYGRWDSPQHAPFRTLNAEHAGDFYNGCFDVTAPLGPREPWHDVAAMITGPVVRDFVQCFEERWRRQGLGSTLLRDVEGDRGIVDGKFEHEEQWTVQVFRSIDERSAVFDREAARRLETKKGRSIDRSIHHAYVHYVRAANRFIYIEQQYFLGSSNQWVSDGHKDGTNLIPHEVALKVVQGILSGNFLRVYVVIPMFPEGLAADSFVQQILFFQMRTVEMIMKKVADAITEAGLEDAHPTDFISFFCLGNRETVHTHDSSSDARSSSESESSDSFQQPTQIPLRRRSSTGSLSKTCPSTDVVRRRPSGSSTVSRRFSSFRRRPATADEELLAMSRRQPIYQHAKVFISDDEVLITGSANLNERSMCGVRDTEIAFSAFQPSHRYKADPYEKDRLPHGEVARFRRRLWAEHALGPRKKKFSKVFEDPGTVECMREMQRIAQRNWADYISPRVVDLKSHLLPYPYDIDRSGNVTGTVMVFPDTRGHVTGTNSGVVPNLLVS